MKKYFVLFICLLLVGCNLNDNVVYDTPLDFDENQEVVTSIDARVDKVLSEMTLEEKIGQMLIVYYSSSFVDDTLRSALEDVKPGGFILFKDNITTYDATLNFIKEIKNTSDIPMFISIDQEGGNVQRLLSLSDTSVSNIPYMNYVGNRNDSDLAYNVGKVIAEELRVFGINMDFAPVIDIWSNPNNTVIGKRSFGDNSELVSSMGLALGKGLSDNGVISVYKHFPGHGDTDVDSHYSLPVINKTKEEFLDLELVPFKNAIDNGAEVIMIGHLAVPGLTGSDIPASLSKKVITDLLRNEMGFDGLVVTDALNMGALTNYYNQEEVYVKAIDAGVDLLLMPSSSRKAVAAIKKAVEDGILSEEQIDESVRKILKLKFEKIEKDYDIYLSKEYLNSKEHQEVLNLING